MPMAKLGFILAVFIVGTCLSATANGLGGGTVVGGRTKVKDVKNNKDIQSLGSYSVDQYNKQQQEKSGDGGSLKFKKVIEAETQVVSGTEYYLKIATLTADGIPKIYDAVVVVKPWVHSKELLTFSPSPSH